MKLKTIKNELTPETLIFDVVIYDLEKNIKKTIELFGKKRNISYNENSSFENGETIRIVIPISKKTFNIFNMVWEDDFIIPAVNINYREKVSQDIELLQNNDLVYDIEKEKIDKDKKTEWNFKYREVVVENFKLIDFFTNKFKEKFPEHHVFMNNVEDIQIYKDFDFRLIGGVLDHPDNRISLYRVGAKLDIETYNYYNENPKYWNSYDIIGVVDKRVELTDVTEKDIEVISVNDFFNREIDKLNKA